MLHQLQSLQRQTLEKNQHLQEVLQRHTKSIQRRAVAHTNNRNNRAVYGTLCVGIFILRLLAETKSTRVLLLSPPTTTQHHAAVATTTSTILDEMSDNDDLLAHHEMAALATDDFAFVADDDAIYNAKDNEASFLLLQQQYAPFSIQDADVSFSYNSTRLSGMNDVAYDFFNGKLCHRLLPPGATQLDALQDDDATPKQKVISVRFNCQTVFEKSIYGTGNYISVIYAMRLAAAAMGKNVAIEFICNDAESAQDSLILPWMTGWFPAPSAAAKEDTFAFHLPSVREACSSYKTVPITHMIPAMQWELRRMAIAMVGIPHAGHPAEVWAEEHLWNANADTATPLNATLQLPSPARDSVPIYPHVELDEAVLHFRCGDLISSNHPSFGFMKFGSFSRHLPRDVRSIGIVTQPFDPSGQTRLYDGGAKKQAKCKKVVLAFVEHLQQDFPGARVSVRNDAKETIALTFARMVMAQHVVVGISSFGAFPAVATFGTGYIRKPDYPKAPNRWLLHKPSIEDVVENVKMVEEPKMMAVQCQKRWGKDGSAVIDWFKDYAMEFD